MELFISILYYCEHEAADSMLQLSFYGASEQNMPGEGRGTFAPVSV